MIRMMLFQLTGILLLSCSLNRKPLKANRSPKYDPQYAEIKSDNSKKDTTKKIKPYNELISVKATTQNGLFKVHKVDDRYYFEIANTILNKDILIVNRISKAAEAFRPSQGLLGYAGDYIGENVVRFEKGPGDKMFLKRV